MRLKRFLKQYPVQMDRERTGFMEYTCTLRRGNGFVTVTMTSLWPPTVADVLRKLHEDAAVVELMDMDFEAYLARQTVKETRAEVRERWEPMMARYRSLRSLFRDDKRELQTLLLRTKV